MSWFGSVVNVCVVGDKRSPCCCWAASCARKFDHGRTRNTYHKKDSRVGPLDTVTKKIAATRCNGRLVAYWGYPSRSSSLFLHGTFLLISRWVHPQPYHSAIGCQSNKLHTVRMCQSFWTVGGRGGEREQPMNNSG